MLLEGESVALTLEYDGGDESLDLGGLRSGLLTYKQHRWRYKMTLQTVTAQQHTLNPLVYNQRAIQFLSLSTIGGQMAGLIVIWHVLCRYIWEWT